MRNPGASGVKLTFTVQGLPAAMGPEQVPPLASAKSRPVTPCVTTWTTPIVVLDVILNVTARVLLHGEGVDCPAAQALTLPKACEKLAETFIAELIVTVHVGLVPEHAPPQPRNVAVPVGVAVSVTAVPLE
jgi:hypothetical protein